MLKLKMIFVYLLLIAGLSVTAQDDLILPEVGDVPLAAKITVTQDADDPTTAIVTGEDGAVFPNAVVVVQNRYTADREITTATITGSFTTRLYGQNQTPYWISAFQNFPSEDAINEAMGVTVYGEGDDNTFYIEADLGGNVPRYRISGTRQTNSVLLDVEMDVTDNLLEFENLEMQIQLKQFVDDITSVSNVISTSQVQRADNQLRFTTEIDYDKNRFSNELYFIGYVRSEDGEWQRWENSVLFGTSSEDMPNHTVTLFDMSDGIVLPYELQVNISESVSSVVINDYIVLPPTTYALEISLKLDSILAHPIEGDLIYEIIRPSGVTDTFEVQVIQNNSPLNNKFIQLVTDNDLLKSYPFDEYGDYEIQLSRSLAFGNGELIEQESMYRIRIAEELYLSPTVLLNIPLQTDNTLYAGVHIIPPMPADVTINVITSQDLSIVTRQANEYGYFVGDSITDEHLYNLTFSATYEDAQGRLWSSNEMNLSGDFMPPELDLVYGRRGLFGYEGIQQAWFDTSIYPDDDYNAGRQPYSPYYARDVAYVPDAPDGGIVAGAWFSDVAVVSPQGMLLDINGIYSGLTGDDTFNQQIGMGVDGIRAGDYAFLFGHLTTEETFGIYGALMVVEDEDAPARVLSPFMDTLNVFGQEVDMFFVPTGIRPAQVLELGETLSIVGQVAPTLPAEVTVTVTSPSGERTRFTDLANAIGYFYSAENNMPLDQIGVWNIDIHTTYRGETSAGYLEPPYPEGDLNYDIYVVPPDNPPLGEGEFMTETRKVTQTYAMEIPEGWTDVRAFATVTTPSWILAHDELTVFPAGTSYTFNPTQLAQQYPNVELLDPAEGNHVADVVTLTLAMTGTDGDGNPAIRTRTYTMLHDVTYTYDEAVIR